MMQMREIHRLREVTARILADFLVVHVSMIAALAFSVVYQAGVGHGRAAQAMVAGFLGYYTAFFWLLSPLFPLVFSLNGFYSRTRSYTGKHKTLVILRGVGFSGALFLGAQFLFFGPGTVGRSVALPFMVFAAFGTISARVLKGVFERRYFVRSKRTPDFMAPRDRVLVVGGAGYIGSLLVQNLLQNGYRVRVLDSLIYGDEPLRPVRENPNLDLIVGDCRNMQDVVKAMCGVESVIHLAAIVGDPACDQDRGQALETNYAATRMLIKIAKGHGVTRFLFASSCSVYGATEFAVDENSAARPLSLYGRTKVDSERVLLDANSDKFHPTILRFATVFGIGYRPRFDLVVNLLTAKARQEGVITVYNGQQWRPFIHVRDVVAAIVRVLEAPVRQVGGQIFNVGDARLNHTLTDVAETIREFFPDVRIERIDNVDRRDYRVNFDKIRSQLGFRAEHTLRQGVEELKNAFNLGVITDYTDLRYHNQRFLQVIGSPGHKDDIDALVMAALSEGQTLGASVKMAV